MAAPPFKVKAVYEYASEHNDDLKFPIGQVINVTELEGDDWYVGEYTDGNGAKQEGLFPSNFVEKYEPAVPTRPTRAARPKSVVQSPAPPPQAAAARGDDEQEEEREVEEVIPLPAASRPQPPPVEIPAANRQEEEMRSPPSAQQSPIARAEPPPAPKPAPAEPAPEVSTPAKGPPPIAPKSNAFKDRIAAFNRAEASPIAPMQPGGRGGGRAKNEYIKKPFVAPPPSRNAYIPPVQKVEPVHKPYIREEDPEIRRTQEEDHAAAEAAGLTGEPAATAEGGEEEEAQPKPMSLKERMAMLQREQEAQRARHAEPAVQKKERKPPTKKASESSERGIHEGEDEEAELERVPTQRQSLDVSRERPRVPSAQRRPAEPPISSMPAPPEHEILSGGEEADQSGAGEMTEDDTGTIGPDDESERRHNEPLPRAPTVPAREPDVGDEEDTAEEPEEEEEMDEEEARKQRLRERMARLAGGQQGGGPFNPFGMPPAAAPAKKRTKDRQVTQEDTHSPPQQQQMPQMVAIPGMGGAPPPPVRSYSPEPDAPARRSATEPMGSMEDENDEPGNIPPPRRSTAEERGMAPPVPKGKISRKPLLLKRKSFAMLWRSGSVVSLVVQSKSSPPKGARDISTRKGCSELRAY
ncbi:hypothetical protein B0A55_01296 [Friedmanniomyces simplex]|uniref:SH3 domain-containing protein n=1 Tax=Friedmanniomyces simplex TaxID=329884 RepID=A0A4U0Y2G9_9PEZI|nr:hypothetical protein B0A55_01296 [Friedmanniomyces simplex]